MEVLRYLVCLVLLITCTQCLKFKEYKRFLEDQSKNDTFVKLFDQHLQRFQVTSSLKNDLFPCEAFQSNKKASSVHELTAADIKVIGAIGDSITAGTGIIAKTPIGLLTQFRGLSWSIGGDGDANEHITLANILKRYSPDLVGYSVESGDFESENAHLNVADPGNEAHNMPFQAKLLVDRMKADKDNIDFENDWKVITMFIGGNDLCNYCSDKAEYTVEKYIGYITEALDIFHNEVPKAFVNVVEVLNIGNVPLLNQGVICNSLHYFTCKCGAFPASDEDKEELRALNLAYQKGLRDLVDSGRYDTKDDFTVVTQPFWSETELPRTPDGDVDLSYFAPDCFHLSERGHEAAASSLWDNMIEPVGQKKSSWKPGEPTECPTSDNPYFYTKKNSQPVQNLGSYHKETLGSNHQESEGSFQKDGSKERNNVSSKFSGDTMAGVAIGVLCMIVLISVVIFISKRRKHTMEKDYLLKGYTGATSYDEI